MIYFTADLHFCHENIIKYTSRPFTTVNEMNATLIENWNSRVNEDDTVCILGDLFYRYENNNYIKCILSDLKGHKHLILGNHDNDWINEIDKNKYFESINSLTDTTILDKYNKPIEVTLCHYPMLSWNNFSKGSYLIFGHIHNNIIPQFWDYIKNNYQMLNAGVDINNFYPVTFDELVVNNKKFKKEH